MANRPHNIDDYMGALPQVPRKAIAKIRQMVACLAPDSVEGIKYNMPTAVLDGTNILYYAAWKSHIGLYPIYPGSAEFEAEIGPFRDKQDTVRFELSQPIPFEVIEHILITRIAKLREKSGK